MKLSKVNFIALVFILSLVGIFAYAAVPREEVRYYEYNGEVYEVYITEHFGVRTCVSYDHDLHCRFTAVNNPWLNEVSFTEENLLTGEVSSATRKVERYS